MLHENSFATGSELATTISDVPKVLVLLASYNAGRFLEEQLASILAQQDVDVQIMIADDLSTDGTREAVLAAGERDARIRLVGWDTASGSAGANFRRLYRFADPDLFDFVALADQDDIWHPRKLVNAATLLSRSEALGYSCAVQAFWLDGREKVVAQNGQTRSADFLFEGAGQGCTFVLTRELFSRVRRFCIEHHAVSERMHYHDWLIYLLARLWSLPWYFDGEPWMRYRQHQSNEIGSRGGLMAVVRRLKLIRNGWFKEQVISSLAVEHQVAERESNLEEFRSLFEKPDSVARRVRMAIYTLRNGRRRLSDRLVMAISSVLGWI